MVLADDINVVSYLWRKKTTEQHMYNRKRKP
jgi:hypothetical protein